MYSSIHPPFSTKNEKNQPCLPIVRRLGSQRQRKFGRLLCHATEGTRQVVLHSAYRDGRSFQKREKRRVRHHTHHIRTDLDREHKHIRQTESKRGFHRIFEPRTENRCRRLQNILHRKRKADLEAPLQLHRSICRLMRSLQRGQPMGTNDLPSKRTPRLQTKSIRVGTRACPND